MQNWRAIFAFLLLFLGGGILQQKPQEKPGPAQPPVPEFKIPPEEAKRQNPVKATAGSLSEGKRLYMYDCAMCHGEDGGGKGDVAVDQGLKLPDLRDSQTLKNFTDGALFYMIAKGRPNMPGDSGRTKPEQRWNIVNYLRSLSGKEPAPKSAAQKQEEQQPR